MKDMAEKVSDKPWGQTKESDHDLEQDRKSVV